MRLPLVLCLAAVAGLAGQAPPQEPSRPSFRTEANYVRVDAYATTRDGAAVGDLRREDFQLLEDRVPQTIDQFSRVAIRAGAAAPLRSDPRTAEEGRQAATDARARVFVLFLDVMHVDGVASRTIAQPLIGALRRLIGPDDLVAIASPQMPLQTMTFTRQLAVVESALSREWGMRDRVDFLDPTERRYADCYPGLPQGNETVARDLGIAQEMILRRREEQTLESLEGLMTYLRDVREERKAVITISNGWRIYRSNPRMERQTERTPPAGPLVAVDPRTGQLSTDRSVAPDRGSACEAERLRFAALDHTRRFRELLDRANRANVSFYPVDPRGVVVFDDDIFPVAGVGQNPAIPGTEDLRRRNERGDSLRMMAEATDGVAVLDTNNFAPALQRIANDLSSYYLLGYYSSGKLDGRFHAITVRVTRPGVQVRARRGYLAATTATAAPVAAAAGDARLIAEAQAVSTALASLGAATRDPAMFLQAAVGQLGSGAPAVWTVLEIPRAALAADWINGGDVDALLIDASGNTAGTGRASVTAGAASARLTIAPRSLAPGSYELRVRARSAGASSASIRVVVPDSPGGSGAVFFRRGPATGNREVATADVRFRRSDTLRVMTPAPPGATPAGARLLDRTGKALAIPVAASAVDEPDGSRWLAAQAALAPLGAGDYVVEISGTSGSTERRTLVAIRVIP
jgi:VWFA-related protein